MPHRRGFGNPSAGAICPPIGEAPNCWPARRRNSRCRTATHRLQYHRSERFGCHNHRHGDSITRRRRRRRHPIAPRPDGHHATTAQAWVGHTGAGQGLAQGDGQRFGVAMPIIAFFSVAPTNTTVFNKVVTVTVNGAPAHGAWYWERSSQPANLERSTTGWPPISPGARNHSRQHADRRALGRTAAWSSPTT